MLDQQDTDPIGRIEACGVIAVLRRYPVDHASSIAAALVGAGLVSIEITLDSPGAVDLIRRLAQEVPGIVVGAGTVRTEAEVAAVADAGAVFVASPVTSPGVIRAARDRGLLTMPGAATPTEIAAAVELGADLVKVFPIGPLGGVDYLRSVLPPLGDPPVVVTGGVGVGNAADYLRAGARAVGVGGSVFGERSQPVDADALQRTVAGLLADLPSHGAGR